MLNSHAVYHGISNGTCFLLQPALERLAALLRLDDRVKCRDLPFGLSYGQTFPDNLFRQTEIGRLKPLSLIVSNRSPIITSSIFFKYPLRW